MSIQYFPETGGEILPINDLSFFVCIKDPQYTVYGIAICRRKKTCGKLLKQFTCLLY